MFGKDAAVQDVVDYGCSHGVDVQYFRSQGFKSKGFDVHPPYGWNDNIQAQSSRVVGSTYVLNVIPTVSGRRKALEAMTALVSPGGFLIVSARSERAVRKEAFRHGWAPYRDGFISHPVRSTFQHGCTVRELTQLGKALGFVPIRVQPDLERIDASCVIFRVPYHSQLQGTK